MKDHLPGASVPDSERASAIKAGGGNVFAIWRPGKRTYRLVRLTRENVHYLAGVDIPDHYLVAIGWPKKRDGDHAAVGRPGKRKDAATSAERSHPGPQ